MEFSDLALFGFIKESTYLKLSSTFSFISSSSYNTFKAKELWTAVGTWNVKVLGFRFWREKNKKKTTFCSYFILSLQILPNLFCLLFTFYGVNTIHQAIITTYPTTKSTICLNSPLLVSSSYKRSKPPLVLFTVLVLSFRNDLH